MTLVSKRSQMDWWTSLLYDSLEWTLTRESWIAWLIYLKIITLHFLEDFHSANVDNFHHGIAHPENAAQLSVEHLSTATLWELHYGVWGIGYHMYLYAGVKFNLIPLLSEALGLTYHDKQLHSSSMPRVVPLELTWWDGVDFCVIAIS